MTVSLIAWGVIASRFPRSAGDGGIARNERWRNTGVCGSNVLVSAILHLREIWRLNVGGGQENWNVCSLCAVCFQMCLMACRNRWMAISMDGKLLATFRESVYTGRSGNASAGRLPPTAWSLGVPWPAVRYLPSITASVNTPQGSFTGGHAHYTSTGRHDKDRMTELRLPGCHHIVCLQRHNVVLEKKFKLRISILMT